MIIEKLDMGCEEDEEDGDEGESNKKGVSGGEE